jgi:hypothetical protein
MQLLSCRVAVAGDDLNVVVREHDTAVTYPEMLVLKALHGSESVRDIEDAGDVDRDPAEERERLSMIYGREVVRQVFPGDHQPLPTQDLRRRKAADVFDETSKSETKPSAAETKTTAGKK